MMTSINCLTDKKLSASFFDKRQRGFSDEMHGIGREAASLFAALPKAYWQRERRSKITHRQS